MELAASSTIELFAVQVLANPFGWPALLGGLHQVPAVFGEFHNPPSLHSTNQKALTASLRATSAGLERDILYETIWQAADTSSTDDRMDVAHVHGTYTAAVEYRIQQGVRQVPLLLRSAVVVDPTESVLMPCPRGSLANLRFVPLQQDTPKPGEVKV